MRFLILRNLILCASVFGFLYSDVSIQEQFARIKDDSIGKNVSAQTSKASPIATNTKSSAKIDKQIIYRDSKIEWEISLKNDVQDGLTNWFYPDGTLRASLNYRDGKLNGSSIWYYRNGSIKKEIVYVDGAPKATKRYSPTGKELDTNVESSTEEK